MEPTLTQNCALYYAQHKTTERGATFSRRFRAAARKRAVLSHSPYATSFQASTGGTETTPLNPLASFRIPDSAEEIGNEQKHCEMIVCVSPIQR